MPLRRHCKKVKVKERIAVNGFPSHSYGTSLAIWGSHSHSVICYPTHLQGKGQGLGLGWEMIKRWVLRRDRKTSIGVLGVNRFIYDQQQQQLERGRWIVECCRRSVMKTAPLRLHVKFNYDRLRSDKTSRIKNLITTTTTRRRSALVVLGDLFRVQKHASKSLLANERLV